MKMIVFALCFVVFASLQVENVLSCICMRMHPQQQYCRAEYAISGRVVSSEWLQIDVHNETNSLDGLSPEDVAWGRELVYVQKNYSIPRFELFNYEIAYTVKVRQVFKSPEHKPIAVGQNLVIRSRPQHGNLCGINLDDSKNYILAGPIHGHIQLCDWAQYYTTITRRQKQGLRRGYKKHCQNCEVKSCHPDGPPDFCKPQRNNICVYGGEAHSSNTINYADEDCIARHSRCQVKGKRGQCRWNTNFEVRQCHMRYGVQEWFNSRNI